MPFKTFETYKNPELVFSDYHIVNYCSVKENFLTQHPFPSLQIKIGNMVQLGSDVRMNENEYHRFCKVLLQKLLSYLSTIDNSQDLESFENTLLDARPYFTVNSSKTSFSMSKRSESDIFQAQENVSQLSRKEGKSELIKHLPLIQQLINYHMNDAIINIIKVFLQGDEFQRKQVRLKATKYFLPLRFTFR